MFVRPSAPPPPPSRRRRGLVGVLVGLAVLYLLSRWFATVWTDYLWFESVGYESVWLTNLGTSLGLGVGGVLVAFGIFWLNIVLTDRTGRRFVPPPTTPAEEVAQRFREWADPRIRRLRVIAAVFFAVVLGGGLSVLRDDYLLFTNQTPFGVADPQFQTDISYFVFRLPFLDAVTGWFVNVIIVALLLVVGLGYLNGNLRFRRSRARTPLGTKAHVSVLLVVLALLQAARYRLASYSLLIPSGGDRIGAGYVDINARLPAYTLLIVVSILAAVVLVANIWRPGWTLAAVSVGSWAFVAVAAGLIYPAVIQRFQVSPNELERERPFIERNIAGTRAGFGLDDVIVRTYEGNAGIEQANLDANASTLDNVRLWDPEVLDQTYKSLQQIRPFYRVDRVDTDRYPLDGVPTQVMISARELDEGGIPQDWQNQRLIYTHGYGVVLSPANDIAPDGQPQLLIRDIPPVSTAGGVTLAEPRIYFGESSEVGKPVIVKTGDSPQEVDYPLAQGTEPTEYDGAAGIGVGSLVRRAAFALRFQELNIFLSDELREDSRVLMERNIREMVKKVAPFAAVDADPYPVILDGRLLWVLDLYTYSSQYPYSHPASRLDTARIPRASHLPPSGFNYIRNPVKATVDAYDGTIRLYVVDPDDPIVQTWQFVYPELMRDASEMPPGLENHFRYPQEIFKLQSEKYLEYHVGDADELFRGVDEWSIPADPSTTRRTDFLYGDAVGPAGDVTYLDKLMPSYLMLRLPEEEDLSYVLMQQFTPLDRPNMASLLVADATPGRYGRLVDYRLPRGVLVEGTSQVANRIDQNDEISGQFTLWRGQGSTVVLGDMLIIPFDGGIIYVQPVYLEAEREGLPELRRIVVVHGNDIGWAPTFGGALEAVFGTGDGEPAPETRPELLGTVEELLARAAQAFEDARAALREGDLAGYQRLVEEAERLVDEAVAAGAPPAEETPAPETTTTVPEVEATFGRPHVAVPAAPA